MVNVVMISTVDHFYISCHGYHFPHLKTSTIESKLFNLFGNINTYHSYSIYFYDLLCEISSQWCAVVVLIIFLFVLFACYACHTLVSTLSTTHTLKLAHWNTQNTVTWMSNFISVYWRKNKQNIGIKNIETVFIVFIL